MWIKCAYFINKLVTSSLSSPTLSELISEDCGDKW